LYLFFHKKQQKLDCTFSLEPGDDIPLAAFLDYMTIITKREGTVEPRLKPQSTNTSIEISKKKSVLKLKKITPENPLYDPFVAAILIALAQAQQRATASSRPHGKGKEAVVCNASILISGYLGCANYAYSQGSRGLEAPCH
jgi:hypothetical protein